MIYTSLHQKIEKGRYKGRALGLVMKTNPNYIQWCLQTMPDFILSEELIERLNKRKSIVEVSDILVQINTKKKAWFNRPREMQLNLFLAGNWEIA